MEQTVSPLVYSERRQADASMGMPPRWHIRVKPYVDPDGWCSMCRRRAKSGAEYSARNARTGNVVRVCRRCLKAGIEAVEGQT